MKYTGAFRLGYSVAKSMFRSGRVDGALVQDPRGQAGRRIYQNAIADIRCSRC